MENFGQRNSRMVSSDKNFNNKIEKATLKNARQREEKSYSAELLERGKKSYFEECFGDEDDRDGIAIKVPLNEQDLPVVGPFEDITKTESFRLGRDRGKFLADNVFTKEMYREKFLPEFYAKYSSIKKHR